MTGPIQAFVVGFDNDGTSEAGGVPVDGDRTLRVIPIGGDLHPHLRRVYRKLNASVA